MAMTVENVIACLRADVEMGRYKADDLLVIDWFSYHDVQRIVLDYDEENNMPDEKARGVWEECAEQIDMQLDQFETEAVNWVITGVVEKELGFNG